jgi:hypothetical protein
MTLNWTINPVMSTTDRYSSSYHQYGATNAAKESSEWEFSENVNVDWLRDGCTHNSSMKMMASIEWYSANYLSNLHHCATSRCFVTALVQYKNGDRVAVHNSLHFHPSFIL